MRIVIESTTKVVMLDGHPVRIWEGRTDTGIPCAVFVRTLRVAREEDNAEFEKELLEHAPPSPEIEAIPARLVF